MNHEYTNVTVNQKYKDTMFRMLFKNKKELLSLYNAVNGSHHANEEDLQIVTLENAIYMNMKNDLAFLIDFHLYLYEHQSTYNPNIPLRNLFYVAREYQKLIDMRSLYSSTMIRIPAPKFIVFYNGAKNLPETMFLQLSDAYYTDETDPQLELKVTMLNINSGNNQQILDKCPTLKEYMLCIEHIRRYLDLPGISLEMAVEHAVSECIKNNILVDFLRQNRAEAISMCIFEFGEREKELLKKTDMDFATEIGIKLADALLKSGRSEDIPKVIADPEYREKLLREFDLLPFYL
ncbi:MAG: hypothetical protein NC416_12650 [Eubacterium sp.]|nr:hypothetical protein [Eubacterium sp.]